MSGKSVLIIGPSGTGKTTSTREMKDTFFINAAGKELPFRNKLKSITLNLTDEMKKVKQTDENIYRMISTTMDKVKKNNVDIKMVISENPQVCMMVMKYVSDNMPEIKKIVLDDLQYIPGAYFMDKVHVKNYEKFNELALMMWNLGKFPKKLREDLVCYYLMHPEEFYDPDGGRQMKAKTFGKLVDQGLGTFEGLFTIVLYTGVEIDANKKPKFFIYTETRGADTCKAPIDMFPQQKFENNLEVIDSYIRKYYYLCKEDEAKEA